MHKANTVIPEIQNIMAGFIRTAWVAQYVRFAVEAVSSNLGAFTDFKVSGSLHIAKVIKNRKDYFVFTDTERIGNIHVIGCKHADSKILSVHADAYCIYSVAL